MSDQHTNISESNNGVPDSTSVDGNGPCMACGLPNARSWETPDGPARLCPPCATLNGIGCP
ncbi:MAG: hypothetical protein F2947_09920 [Actinobacteria bacterium]|nr:hypothetical protein [Actinomycetota bacterium]MTA43441.1 hypothetical protein [Actinomycetota bacterium]MTA45620.1 hypothetical protein [Actinomycetota bacterium]